MEKQIRRVQNSDELYERIADYQFRGYSLQEHDQAYAELKKSDFGHPGIHFIWFLLTFWWTLGLGNLGYMIFAYLVKSKIMLIKNINADD